MAISCSFLSVPFILPDRNFLVPIPNPSQLPQLQLGSTVEASASTRKLGIRACWADMAAVTEDGREGEGSPEMHLGWARMGVAWNQEDKQYMWTTKVWGANYGNCCYLNIEYKWILAFGWLVPFFYGRVLGKTRPARTLYVLRHCFSKGGPQTGRIRMGGGG